MITKIKKVSIYLFFVLFFVCFSFILASNLMGHIEYNYKMLTLAFYVIVALCLLGLVYLGLSKYESFLNQHYKTILYSFLSIMIILQISFGSMLRFTPAFDIGAVFQGAVDWTQTGSFSNYHDYYYSFSNNLGAMTFLHFFFDIASFFKTTDYIFVAMLVNSILSISMMAVVFFTCKRILSIKHAVFSLALFALSLPFYFMAPVFYTDALSMLFPILFYYLYLRWKDATVSKNRIILSCLMGIVAFIGMMIKFTVVIMVIAVAIDMFININWKKAIIAATSVLIIIVLSFSIFNGYIYSNHLDIEKARKQNDPFTHWIMMGLKGSGGYNPQDYDLTRAFDNQDDKIKANIEEIKKRVKEYGPDGMFELFTRKSVKCFGDGTYALADFLGYRKDDKNILHRYVVFGDKYDFYKHVCEAMFFSIMILMLCFASQYILGRKDYLNKIITATAAKGKESDANIEKTDIILAPPLSIFGLFLFLLAWETSARYIMNFIPVIFICAALGIDFFFVIIKRIIATLKYGINKIC